MMKQGHFVITTNFDYLLEYALLDSGINKNDIIPVITKEDFNQYSDPEQLVRDCQFPVYKIHGSPQNIITNRDTKDSLVATIQAFGSGKEGESVFQLEPHKRLLFENISDGRTLVVMGYSGSDDFDIVPTLKQLDKLKQIVWIDHSPKESKSVIQSVHSESNFSAKDKVGKILHEIQQMGFGVQLFRVSMHTSEVGNFFHQQKIKVSQISFSEDPKVFLSREINTPDEFLKFHIPFEIYEKMSLVEDAERCSRVIADRARTQKNLKWESSALNNIGILLHRRGIVDEGLRYLKDALAINEQIEYLPGKAECLTNIGMILDEKLNLDEALTYYEKSLAIYENLENQKEIATVFNNIGMVLYRKGNFDEALTYFKNGLTLAEQLGNLRSKAVYLNNIGLVLVEKAKLDEALSYYKEALAIAKQLGNLWSMSTYLNNIGDLLRGKIKLDEALSSYKEGLAIAKQLGDLRRKEYSFFTIGRILFEMEKYEQALQYFEERLKIQTKLEINTESTVRWINLTKTKMKKPSNVKVKQ
jgi:tetratricopeptide (TPR) repeat protein